MTGSGAPPEHRYVAGQTTTLARELRDALGPDAYWKAPTWKRLVAIGEVPSCDSGRFPAVLGNPAAVAYSRRVREEVAKGDSPDRQNEWIRKGILGVGLFFLR